MTQWRWLLVQFSRQLWVRASLFAALGVVTALVSALVQPFIPLDIPGKIGADQVDNILNILATSMLAVTTFSLSVMVSSYAAATQNVTPRATRLLIEDGTTQTVLSTFLGSFLFSLVGIITLGMGAYGSSGRVVLLVVTLGVIVVIVAAILRWIDHLSRFGRVEDTTRRVEHVATKALKFRMSHPELGARRLMQLSHIPDHAKPVLPPSIGYIQHVDLQLMSAAADELRATIYVTAVPGTFVDLATRLACVDGDMDAKQHDGLAKRVRAAFTIGDSRSFDQDPRFGVSVLAEIASRALSPAVNDVGTAIDVIGRAVRLLSIWAEPENPESGEVDWPRIFVAPVTIDDMFDDIFTPIARDGAGLIEIQIRLQKALASLARLGGPFAKSAKRHADQALDRALQSLDSEHDRQKLTSLVTSLRGG